MSDAVQRESTLRRGFYDDVDGDESKLPVDPVWLDTFERAYDAGMWPQRGDQSAAASSLQRS